MKQPFFSYARQKKRKKNTNLEKFSQKKIRYHLSINKINIDILYSINFISIMESISINSLSIFYIP